MTHTDIIKQETPDKKFMELGYDRIGLCVVHWFNFTNGYDQWEWIRHTTQHIIWKNRCTIMLINDIELNINLEDTNNYKYDNLCFSQIW